MDWICLCVADLTFCRRHTIFLSNAGAGIRVHVRMHNAHMAHVEKEMKKSLALVLALLSAAVLHAEWGFKSSTVITNGNWEIGVSVKNDVDTTLTS